MCDRNWLIQAISNIVKNAFDHTRKDNTICIEWKQFASVVQIVIKDNGSGIHPEDLHHIFKRFYRSHFSKDIRGIGLGLPLAKAIIEAHSGTIEFNLIPELSVAQNIIFSMLLDYQKPDKKYLEELLTVLNLKERRHQRTTSTYMALQMFIYGFLAIITLVTILNIMNSISMSVSERIKQYGTMRAVGCVIGLLISKLLYDTLITTHFSYATWSVPTIPLAIILLFVFVAAIAAVYTPSKRIRNISVTDTINEL